MYQGLRTKDIPMWLYVIYKYKIFINMIDSFSVVKGQYNFNYSFQGHKTPTSNVQVRYSPALEVNNDYVEGVACEWASKRGLVLVRRSAFS